MFRSKLKIEMIGWQVSRGPSVLKDYEIEAVEAIGTAKAKFAINSNIAAREGYRVQTGEIGLSLPDPIAMAIALDRSLGLSWSRHRVAIECDSELTRGMTVVDRLNVSGDANNAKVWRAPPARATAPISCGRSTRAGSRLCCGRRWRLEGEAEPFDLIVADAPIDPGLPGRMTMITELWASSDLAVWEKVLAGHEALRPENVPLERRLENMGTERLSEMSPKEWAWLPTRRVLCLEVHRQESARHVSRRP